MVSANYDIGYSENRPTDTRRLNYYRNDPLLDRARELTMTSLQSDIYGRDVKMNPMYLNSEGDITRAQNYRVSSGMYLFSRCSSPASRN